MENFKDSLQKFEEKIPEEDSNYYRNVTKPVYERLMDEVEERFKQLKMVAHNSMTENLQSLLVTGYIDVNDRKRVKKLEPIINVNQAVQDVIKRKDGAMEVHLKCDKNNYLFSFICDCPYEEYMQMDKCEVRAELELDGADQEVKKLVYHHNNQYKEKELELKGLFVSNRPQSSYFEIPLCRRIIDVYSKEDIQTNMDVVLRINNLPGKIGIPVWNIISSDDTYNGSGKDNHPEKKVVMPYGLSGERNQYVIRFECSEKDAVDMLDGVIKINDYTCNYMFSQYDRDEKMLKLYTFDKKAWGHKFSIYQIVEVGEDESCLWGKKIYSCLDEFVKKVRIQKNFTEANIYYYVNVFVEFTGLKLKSMRALKDSGNIELEFDVVEQKCGNMEEEYASFIISLLNDVFIGHQFEGQVIQHG